MAGMLPKDPGSFFKIPDARVAIIGSMWHGQYVSAMMERARAELLRCDVFQKNIQMHSIPGSLELPFAARVLFERFSDIDAILAFGVVLQGLTSHDQTVLSQVSHGFSLVSDRVGKPIINEVIGVVDLKDAAARSGDDSNNKGVEAVFALTELLTWKKSLLPSAVKVGF
ncbi:MAG TPA: 6,7-dimethyl-8-ribityllumazine synthase [Oligoflexia bacterium]|nr:6,7-dimethyl-8-ribityllumazine synthase [Oligoflexia bacterium]HMP47330.1 6,7-dimethyl-8-ribityllumazine synthase [Oligoflexia bacterium]